MALNRVLPFVNLSSEPDQEYFADGIVEEIITALSRFKTLFVIARNSSFTYRGRAADVKQVGRELGVRYVLEGSIRKSANRVRITGQLVDTTIGTNIGRIASTPTLEHIFDLQDQLSAKIVGATRQGCSRLRSKGQGSSRPRAFTRTTITCVEWRAFITEAGKRLPKAWSCSKSDPT